MVQGMSQLSFLFFGWVLLLRAVAEVVRQRLSARSQGEAPPDTEVWLLCVGLSRVPACLHELQLRVHKLDQTHGVANGVATTRNRSNTQVEYTRV